MLPLKKILCPIDFSETSYAALKNAHEFAASAGAALLLAHVIPFPAPNTKGFHTEAEAENYAREETEKKIRRILAEQTTPYENIQILIRFGSPAGVVISEIAEQENADLIVMGTQGLTGWRRLVIGSVAEEVLRTASCPVMVVRLPHAAPGTS